MRFCRVVRVDRGAGNDGALRHFGSEARLILGCTPQSRPFRFPDLTGKLSTAEYMFYLIGSAEPPKGNYGKGYDFGIDPPEAEKKKR